MKDIELHLGRYEEAVEARLAHWEAAGFGRRLEERDPTLWSAEPVPELADRMGWLGLPYEAPSLFPELSRFARERASVGLRRAVVLGMGGSSLAPEVFSRSFGTAPGFLAVEVLDSTHPDAVAAAAERFDPATTLFLVSSKSGTTTETLSLFRFFWERAGRLDLSPEGGGAGSRFAAITDPGTSLEELARERGFAAVWNAPEEVGGRYSALTTFGLVPAALAGVDVERLVARAREMADACGPAVPAAGNPGLVLGAVLGELAFAGRDKLTFVTSDGIASFPDWLEQLIAESTGKHGRGIVPVVGEGLGAPADYGTDRVFAALLLPEAPPEVEERLAALAAAGHPVITVRLHDALDLGREIFRWEVAVAAAGAVLGINPFDQPDVQLAKELAQKAMKARAAGEEAARQPAVAVGDEELARALSRWLDGAAAGEYLGLQAFLPMTPGAVAALHEVQGKLRERTGLAVTSGFGPRFLHSTGQLHKGGPGSGRFLQIVDDPSHTLPVPETAYSFRELIRAQADGDRQALEQRGRRVLRVDLGGEGALAGLERLRAALEVAR